MVGSESEGYAKMHTILWAVFFDIPEEQFKDERNEDGRTEEAPGEAAS